MVDDIYKLLFNYRNFLDCIGNCSRTLRGGVHRRHKKENVGCEMAGKGTHRSSAWQASPVSLAFDLQATLDELNRPGALPVTLIECNPRYLLECFTVVRGHKLR